MPSAIIFEPEKNTKHFVVIVGSDFEFINEETTSQMIELKALMTGTDESAF